MNRSGAAQVATQARKAAAAHRRGMKRYREAQANCPHTDTFVDEGPGYRLLTCSACGITLGPDDARHWNHANYNA